MDDSFQNKLAMYLAVKAVCDAKRSVWQRSETFADAFADFCKCLDNITQLQAAFGVFRSVVRGIPVQTAVADTILTTEMDELIERFEQVDEQFVDDYTAARSIQLAEDQAAPELAPRASCPTRSQSSPSQAQL
jgi:hypothetical protein